MSMWARSLGLLPLHVGPLMSWVGGSCECRETSSRPTAAVQRRERVMRAGVLGVGCGQTGVGNRVSRFCSRFGGGWQEKGGIEGAATPAPL